ncbi:MAG: hypothetical protein M3Y45_01365 [Actinomycetota bacterium]|nr:hypothetical protein [Actinomycetota bacterium]
MSTRTETENITTSGPEKVLAGILAIFILIGGVWAYGQIGKISEETYYDDYSAPFFEPARDDLSPTDKAALKEARRAEDSQWRARHKVRQAKRQVTFAGDAYRTELDAGLTGGTELGAYREAQSRLAHKRADLAAANLRVSKAEPAAVIARQNLSDATERRQSQKRADDRLVFAGRFLLITAMLAAGVGGMSRVRKRRSPFMPLALAQVSAAALLAAWMAVDYGSRVIVFREIGPLAISIVGICLTVTAFVLLHRYLSRKLPLRRVRRGECPFCGFPGRGNGMCEGCGRTIVGPCATCQKPRRIATPHCGSCGAT